MAITLEKKQGLIAGDGLLPVKMAQYAKENGFEVFIQNTEEFEEYTATADEQVAELMEELGIKVQ